MKRVLGPKVLNGPGRQFRQGLPLMSRSSTAPGRLNNVLFSCTERLCQIETRLDILDETFSAKCQAVDNPSEIYRRIRAPTGGKVDKLTLPTYGEHLALLR